MTETPATYDCGATCTCDAVTDLAAERTEVMEEMAAALEAEAARRAYAAGLGASEWEAFLGPEARAVLAKYRGEGE